MRHPGRRATAEIARRLEHAIPSAKRRARRDRKHARARPPEMPVVGDIGAAAGGRATLGYAAERIEQLLDRWTERDPGTIAGQYYLDLLDLYEQLSILIGD